LGEKGEWGGREVERERERLRERGRELKKCRVYFDPWGGGCFCICFFVLSFAFFLFSKFLLFDFLCVM
jgi:hypothetical protein